MKLYNVLIILLWGLAVGMIPGGNQRAGNSASSPESKLLFEGISTDVSDYLWPTDASFRITSSFAEYRSMHFHGGLDISTNGETGHNVFAVRDGYLYRISIQPNGYGKMLFIRHPDGYFSVYVHLQKFNERIEQVARQEQLRRGAYAVDMTFQEPIVEVKKGEIIAYSGETGVGPPHLHFEIRDQNLNNVNPMLIYGDSLVDNISPTIRGIAVFPAGINSMIDGKPDAKYMSRLNRVKGGYKIPQTIRIHGEAGFGIKAFDMANGVRNKAGIYRMELYIDDSLAFVKQQDRFPADQTKQIYLDYDFPTILQGKGEFQKLFVEEGSSLPFYGNQGYGDGIINTNSLAEGEHSFKILCKDYHQNTSALEGKLFVNHTPLLELVRADQKELALRSPDNNSLVKFTISGKKLGASAWTTSVLKKEGIKRNEDNILLSFNSAKYDIVKIVAESKLGIASQPLVHFHKKPAGNAAPVKMSLKRYPDYIRVNLTTKGTFTDLPLMTIKEGFIARRIPLEMQSLSEYSGAFKPSIVSSGVHRIEVEAEVNGTAARASEMLELYAIPTNTAGSFSLGNEGLILSYDSGSVYQPFFLSIANHSTASSTKFEFSPKDIILNKGFKISVPALPKEMTEKHGLYFRGTGGWVLHASKLDQEGSYFSTTLNRTLGELAVMKDEQPPSIGKLRFAQTKGFVNGNFRYSDNLSGVDFDEIKIYVGDQIIIPEIDGEHSRVWFKSETPLLPGKHTLTVTMKDRMKNESKVTKTFTVKTGASNVP